MMLLDINMPGGIDGVDVLRRIKDDPARRRIPVVMLTTSDDPREVERCYSLGCNVYMTKPVEPNRLHGSGEPARPLHLDRHRARRGAAPMIPGVSGTDAEQRVLIVEDDARRPRELEKRALVRAGRRVRIAGLVLGSAPGARKGGTSPRSCSTTSCPTGTRGRSSKPPAAPTRRSRCCWSPPAATTASPPR